jgi:glyoxylase-like metal-dependent hydrolase (beta-lactamase superfamily II)
MIAWQSPISSRQEDAMRKALLLSLLALCAGWLAPSPPALAQTASPRLYVLYCGDIALNDASSFTPGASGPGALSVSCYLVKHGQDWLLWDTGLPDSLVGMPNGMKSNAGVWTSKKTLASQLAELALKPADIRYLALSHSHPDHVGNLNLFPQATLVVQKAEYDWVQPFGGPRFKPEQPAIKLEGDRDLFGDGSVVLISTPGHSPGHQCLLVRLPKTGAILLSGDAVHTRANWDSHRVPERNFNIPQSLASLDRMAAVLKETNGQLWIGHEISEVGLRRYAPDYYE